MYIWLCGAPCSSGLAPFSVRKGEIRAHIYLLFIDENQFERIETQFVAIIFSRCCLLWNKKSSLRTIRWKNKHFPIVQKQTEECARSEFLFSRHRNQLEQVLYIEIDNNVPCEGAHGLVQF